MFATWKRQPTNRALLFKAFGPLKPVLAQLQRSGYIFIFNLPWALAQATISRCNLWLLRLMHSLAQGKKSIEDSDEVIAGLAGYLGPRQPERVETEIASTYGQTVIRRSKESAPFTEPLRYYREGLATNPWNQDLETILKLNAIAEYNSIHGKRRVSQGFASGLEGALGVPATILFGMRDVALDTRIMLEGLDEYLTRGSHIVQLPKLGHWSVRQGDGPATIAAVIRWELEEGKGDGLEERIREVSASAKITTSK